MSRREVVSDDVLVDYEPPKKRTDRSLVTDVDENGEPIRGDEPKVSALTGKRRKGNPREMDGHKVNRAVKLIKKGSYVKPAIIAAGLNYNTHLGWMTKGKKGIKPYDEYYEKIERAKAESETDIVEMLNESIETGNTGVAQWMLSRKFPKRWEKTERSEVKVDNTQKIELVRYSDKKDKDKED